VDRTKPLVSPVDIARPVTVLLGHKILLDEEMATLNGVETKALIQAGKRSAIRFFG